MTPILSRATLDLVLSPHSGDPYVGLWDRAQLVLAGPAPSKNRVCTCTMQVKVDPSPATHNDARRSRHMHNGLLRPRHMRIGGKRGATA